MWRPDCARQSRVRRLDYNDVCGARRPPKRRREVECAGCDSLTSRWIAFAQWVSVMMDGARSRSGWVRVCHAARALEECYSAVGGLPSSACGLQMLALQHRLLQHSPNVSLKNLSCSHTVDQHALSFQRSIVVATEPVPAEARVATDRHAHRAIQPRTLRYRRRDCAGNTGWVCQGDGDVNKFATELIGASFGSAFGGRCPWFVFSKLHRSILDPNRDIDVVRYPTLPALSKLQCHDSSVERCCQARLRHFL